MMRSGSTARATLLILFSACCFGSIGVLVAVGLRSGATLLDLLVWRFAIAALLLLLVSGRAILAAPRERAMTLLLLAGGGQAAIAFVSLSALRYISVATLTFLFYTYPAWVAVIAALRRLERLTVQRAVALLLALTGIVLMVGTPGAGGLHPTGVALALGSALLYALYLPMIDHFRGPLDPAVTSTFASGGAALVLGIGALARGGLALRFTPAAWGVIGLLAVLCTVLAFLAFLRGLRALGPTRTAIVSTIEPFWTALLGGLVLGQLLGGRVLLGGAAIAAAVVVLQLRQRGGEVAVAA